MTPLKTDDLLDIVSQYMGCACFSIELKILGESSKMMGTVQLHNYLVMKKNAQYILSEQNTTGTLTRLTRQRLIKLLAYLINDEYNGLASVKEIHSICESTIALFPCLADEAGGISKLYAPPGGFLYNRLRNAKRHNVQQQDQNCNEIGSSDDDENFIENSLESENHHELMQYFKNCVVRNSVEELKTKMSECVEFRRRILMNPPASIHMIFPFYFLNSELILFDFGLLFKGINEGSLFEVWPTIKDKPREIYQIRLDENVVVPTNDQDILDFIHLLKFIPARRVLLSNAVKQFLVFSKNQNEDPMKLMQPRNPHPVIIAIVATVPIADVKYFVGWQDRIFSVPKEFSFVQVMDMFYKIHKVFNLEFNSRIKPMMSFIDHFIFKFPDQNSITPSVKDAAIKLLQD